MQTIDEIATDSSCTKAKDMKKYEFKKTINLNLNEERDLEEKKIILTPGIKLSETNINFQPTGKKEIRDYCKGNLNKIEHNFIDHDQTKQFKDNSKENSVLMNCLNKRIIKAINKKNKKNDIKISKSYIRKNTTLTSQIFEQRLIAIICGKFYSSKSSFKEVNKVLLFSKDPPKNQNGLEYENQHNEIKKATDFLAGIGNININEEIKENDIQSISNAELYEILYYYGLPKCYIQKGKQYLLYFIIIHHFDKIHPLLWNTNKKVRNYMILLKNSMELAINSFTSFNKFMQFFDAKFKFKTFEGVDWKCLLRKYKKQAKVKQAFVKLLNDNLIRKFIESTLTANRQKTYTIKSLLDCFAIRSNFIYYKNIKLHQIPPTKILIIIKKMNFN